MPRSAIARAMIPGDDRRDEMNMKDGSDALLPAARLGLRNEHAMILLTDYSFLKIHWLQSVVTERSKSRSGA